MKLCEEKTIVTRIRLKDKCKADFSKWQADLHAKIVTFKGFISLEILAPTSKALYWTVIERFDSEFDSEHWLKSKEWQDLQKSLNSFLEDIQEQVVTSFPPDWGVTEIFVTHVNNENTDLYRSWIGKIHEAEAKFPGFRGVYVKSPAAGQGENWITLLRFDSQEHLDRWMNSQERQEALQEAKPLISSIETHRVISPFAGWFAIPAIKGKVPVWKQACLILLVLFPIVMLELKFLYPWTQNLNPSLATFIGNAISVTLVSWPMMPIAIHFFKSWLIPSDSRNSERISLIGFIIVLMLYLLEIAIFWRLIISRPV